MVDYFKNGFNYVHFLGSCVLAIGLYTKFFHNELAFIIAFGAGLLWEFSDELYSRSQFKGKLDWLFDPAGFDLRDLVMDLSGIFLAMWLIC